METRTGWKISAIVTRISWLPSYRVLLAFHKPILLGFCSLVAKVLKMQSFKFYSRPVLDLDGVYPSKVALKMLPWLLPNDSTFMLCKRNMPRCDKADHLPLRLHFETQEPHAKSLTLHTRSTTHKCPSHVDKIHHRTLGLNPCLLYEHMYYLHSIYWPICVQLASISYFM